MNFSYRQVLCDSKKNQVSWSSSHLVPHKKVRDFKRIRKIPKIYY